METNAQPTSENSLGRELVAGVTTFFTMSYIVIAAMRAIGALSVGLLFLEHGKLQQPI